jgi:hypothetical protein
MNEAKHLSIAEKGPRDSVLVWWDWVVGTTPELVAAGIPQDEVAQIRLERAGIHKPMTKQWAQTIGLWGGQKTCKEIAQVTGLKESTVRSYAQYRGLGLSGRGSPPIPQVEVAIHAHRMCVHYPERALLWIAKNACKILPPEYAYYIRAIQAFEDMMKESEGLDLDELLNEYALADVQEFWVASKCLLKAPWGTDAEDNDLPDLRTRLRG